MLTVALSILTLAIIAVGLWPIVIALSIAPPDKHDPHITIKRQLGWHAHRAAIASGLLFLLLNTVLTIKAANSASTFDHVLNAMIVLLFITVAATIPTPVAILIGRWRHISHAQKAIRFSLLTHMPAATWATALFVGA